MRRFLATVTSVLLLVRDLFIEYVRRAGAVSARVEGRITSR